MRRNIIMMAALVLAVASASAADFSRNVKLMEQTPQSATLRVTATSPDKKSVQPLAVMSALDTWLFVGFPEVNGGQPLLDESLRSEHATYFERIYDGGRYTVFVKGTTDVQKPKKTPAGEWETTVDVELYTKSLERDLRNSGVLSGGDKSPAKASANMPSIMVVPYKSEGDDYKRLLDSDFDRRMAIAKVQEEFNARGVKTVDFEARLKATQRADEFEYDNAASADDALLKNSGADVYVTVDIEKGATPRGLPKVSLTMRAYDTATGTVLASATSSLDGRSSTPFDRLTMLAVQKVARGFLTELATNLAGEKGGSTMVSLRIGVDENSTLTLDEAADGEDFSIADMIRAWVGKHAVEGKFHQQGQTATLLVFDSVSIPVANLEGETLTPADFAKRLTRYLKRQDLECTSRVDGNTIYITITE